MALALQRLGENSAAICVYIGNQPRFDFTFQNASYHSVTQGEIEAIGKACGNGWRKVFNVYAKWLYASPKTFYPHAHNYSRWQDFRDGLLLQENSDTALIFDAPDFSNPKKIHLVMGRTYAKTLNLPNTLVWINQDFAIDVANNLVVCPYFDYRQLSNCKIAFLVALINKHLSGF